MAETHQEAAHGEGHDYVAGSPHLRHAHLRNRVASSLRSAVVGVLERQKTCEVLEVGAGHGEFTRVLRDAGAFVTVTEMSRPSAEVLKERYDVDQQVEIILDPDGTWLESSGRSFDIIACISVLHHIPDYLAFLALAAARTKPGGSIVSWQDPLWYPRRSRLNRTADKAAYIAWRLAQGEWQRGISTQLRRLRGIYDESEPSDMVEYHVVRSGVDEEAIEMLLKKSFGSVTLHRYWSTQSPIGQRLGERFGRPTSFGVVATLRLGG